MFDNIINNFYDDFNKNRVCSLSEQFEYEIGKYEEPKTSNSPLVDSIQFNDDYKGKMTEDECKTTNQNTNININIDNNIKINNIINLNNNINIENNSIKKEITILSKKRGRTPNKNKNKKRNGQSKKRLGNALNKIINSCIHNLHFFIEKRYKNINVDKPTTSNISGQSHKAKREFLNKTIYELYCDNIMTKRFKGDTNIKEKVDKKKRIEMKREEYKKLNKNKKALDSFLNDNNLQNMMFFKEIKFRDFMVSYLNNEKKICKRDENNNIIFGISLTGFETYEQSFNGEYSSEEKNKYKNHVFAIMLGTSNDRNK